MEKSPKSQEDIDETEKLIEQQTNLKELVDNKEKLVTILLLYYSIYYCRLLEHKLELAATLEANECKYDEEHQKVTALEERESSLATSIASLKVFNRL